MNIRRVILTTIMGLCLLALVRSPVSGATRVAYTRPGFMMKIPVSYVHRSPYLFRTGFGSEIHNFTNFNMAKGVYFDMELGKNFLFGFSSVMAADTARSPIWGRSNPIFRWNLGFIYSNGSIATMIFPSPWDYKILCLKMIPPKA